MADPVKRRAGRWWDWPYFLLLAGMMAALVATVAWLSLGDPAGTVYGALLSRPEVRLILGETLLVGGVTAAATLLLALPTALLISGRSRRWRMALIWMVAICAFTPFLVRAYAFVGLLGFEGPFYRLLEPLGLAESLLIGSRAAVVLVMVAALLPSAILIILVGLTAQLRLELTAAAILGASPLHRLLLVLLPRLAPAIAGAAVITFVAAAGAFVAPALIGAGRETLVGQLIYEFANDTADLPAAAALAMILAAVTLVPVVALARIRSDAPFRGYRLRLWRLMARLAGRPALHAIGGGGRTVVAAGGTVSLLLILLPLLFVMLVSLQPKPLLMLPLDGLSLRWYARVATDPTWIEAGLVTLRIALVSALIATIVAGLGAGLVRRRRFAEPVAAAALAPAALPALMLAVGLYHLLSGVQLIDREFGVVIAHAVVAVPIAFLMMRAALLRYDPRFDEIAAVLGATPAVRLAAVRVPVLLPGLLTTLLLTILISFDELVVTQLVAGTQVRTLALRMWSAANQNIGPELAVPATLMILASVAVMLAILWRRGGSPDLLVPSGTAGSGW